MSEAATRKQKVRYRYDALDRRVARNLGGGRELTKFTYDGDDVFVDDNFGTLTKYLNGAGIDNKLRSTTGSTASYFLTDNLGSTNGLANSSGVLTSQTSYDSLETQQTRASRRVINSLDVNLTVFLAYNTHAPVSMILIWDGSFQKTQLASAAVI
jgi:YD repeat-containing protein